MERSGPRVAGEKSECREMPQWHRVVSFPQFVKSSRASARISFRFHPTLVSPAASINLKSFFFFCVRYAVRLELSGLGPRETYVCISHRGQPHHTRQCSAKTYAWRHEYSRSTCPQAVWRITDGISCLVVHSPAARSDMPDSGWSASCFDVWCITAYCMCTQSHRSRSAAWYPLAGTTR